MNDSIEREQNKLAYSAERENGGLKVKEYFLDVLHRMGIDPTDNEFTDFENRLIGGLWNKIKQERMDERLIT